MLNKLFPFITLIAILCISAFSQKNEQIASVYHSLHKIESKILNENRTIWVRTPLNYLRTDEKFPVVYMLDGHAPQPSMMAGIIEQQSWGRKMPEMILVSIQNTNRSRDLTPTNNGGKRDVGGGDKFLKFIENEVMPLVEENYRTESFKVFAGHSLGGLTVVYAFATRPDLFNAYIAASPVLHYDNYFVIKETEKMFEQKRSLNKTMFLGLGDEPNYNKGWNKFQKLLKSKKPKNFKYEFQDFPEDNHASVVMPIYYNGLRMIFNNWFPEKAQSILDITRHYKKLSKRFGYEIKIPQATLNRAAYYLLRQKKFAEAIKYFKQNAETYPKSENVYDSLGDAYHTAGNKKKAIESFRKAYKLSLNKGNKRFAEYVKVKINKIENK